MSSSTEAEITMGSLDQSMWEFIDNNEPVVPESLAEHEGNATCPFDDLIIHLQDFIQSYETIEGEISIKDFLKTANYKLVTKQRYTYQRRWLISEEDVYYGNLSTETAKFTHTCQYDQKSSVSLQMSKGHSFGISGGLGFRAFGKSVGLNASYDHSRTKTDQQIEDQAKSKISTVEVTVKLNTAVVVKELIYEAEKTADCILQLVLGEEEKIKYSNIDKGETHEVEVKKLWKKCLKSSKCKWVGKEDNLIYCTFTSKCYFYTTEHRMETIALSIDPDRAQTIVDKYTPQSRAQTIVDENTPQKRAQTIVDENTPQKRTNVDECNPRKRLYTE